MRVLRVLRVQGFRFENAMSSPQLCHSLAEAIGSSGLHSGTLNEGCSVGFCETFLKILKVVQGPY